MTLATIAKRPGLAGCQIAERLLLSMSAGAVNAGAFLACQRFVSHVTGTVTLIGLDFGRWPLLGEYMLVLLCFLVGAMTAVFLLAQRWFRVRDRDAAGVRLVAALPWPRGANLSVRRAVALLAGGTFVIALFFAMLPFLSGSTLSTRWLMFSAWAFAVGAASDGKFGGLRVLMALRQILALGCGATVVPKQMGLSFADQALNH